MLKKRILAFLLLMTMLLPTAGAAEDEAAPRDGIRGVWVASVQNIDYPSDQGLSADALKSEADEMLDNIAAMGLNTVFLQVRPSADALYSSSLFPWSRYVSGTAGEAPDGGLLGRGRTQPRLAAARLAQPLPHHDGRRQRVGGAPRVQPRQAAPGVGREV